MNIKQSYTADLVAFVRPADLPPSLLPFVKKGNQDDEDIRCLVLKIRGTVDSYYGLTIDKSTELEHIKERINADLAVVRISDEAQAELRKLLNQFRAGQFAHYLRHQIDRAKHPHRH